MKRKLLSLFAVFVAALGYQSASAQNYQHLTVTSGYNADVIANGVGAASNSTSIGVDNANYSFVSADFQATASSNAPVASLPATGLVNSAVSTGLSYQLGPYTGNNSLRLATANATGTLAFTNQISATKLFVLAATGSGTATTSAIITFNDNTTQTVTGTVVPDWFFSNAMPVAISGFGRINRLTNVLENPTADPRLYQWVINILPANQTKQVVSIQFTKTSTAEGALNVMAVSAQVLEECPSPDGLTAVSMPNGATISWSAPAVAPAGGYDYYYSTTNTPPTTSTTPTGTVTAGTSLDLASLNTNQQYYVWVRSHCSNTSTGSWVMATFTTGQTGGTYTGGDISTLYNETPTITSTSTCPGTMTVVVPAGYQISSISTAYTMTTASNGWKSEQRSILACTTTNTTEAAISSGVGGEGGTYAYNRTGLTFANGATGTVQFELRAWRTYGSSGCNTTYNKVDAGSWTVTVNYAPLDCTPPAAPTAEAQAFCAGATVAGLTATGITGAQFNWYTAATGGTALSQTAVLSNATYYVSQVVNGCESARVPVAITINTVPAPTVDTTQDFCSGALVVDLNATGVSGGTLVWSSTPGGNELVGDVPLEAQTYYVYQTVGECQSQSIAVTVSLFTAPQPIVTTTQSLCTGATVADLAAQATTGGTIEWSLTNGGLELASTTELSAGTYYVRQQVNSCESLSIPVTVTINNIEAPTAAAQQVFCSGATVADLAAEGYSGSTINWMLTDGGTPLAPAAELVSGTYYVNQTVGSCTSITEMVAVTVNPVPEAPIGDAIQEFNTGDTVSALTVTTAEGSEINWYMYNLVGELVSIDEDMPLFDGVTYYVSQTINGCPSSFLAITAEEALAVSAFETTGFKAYPNPVIDILNIDAGEAIRGIAVYNLLGQKIKYTQGPDLKNIDLTSLNEGTYIVKVFTDNKEALLKIVKR